MDASMSPFSFDKRKKGNERVDRQSLGRLYFFSDIYILPFTRHNIKYLIQPLPARLPYVMMVLPNELYVGAKDRSTTQPRVILVTPTPPLWTAGSLGRRYRIRRLYADLPASFQYLGNQGDMFFVIKDARASVLIKEAIELRFEPVSTTTSNVKVGTLCTRRRHQSARFDKKIRIHARGGFRLSVVYNCSIFSTLALPLRCGYQLLWGTISELSELGFQAEYTRFTRRKSQKHR